MWYKFITGFKNGTEPIFCEIRLDSILAMKIVNEEFYTDNDDTILKEGVSLVNLRLEVFDITIDEIKDLISQVPTNLPIKKKELL